MPRKSIKEAPADYFKMKDFVEKSKDIKPKEVFGSNYKQSNNKEDNSKKNNIKKK